MTDTTDIKALRESAESIMNLLENLAGYEPQDIDMDAVELRFEDENGVYTGCDISIVDTAQQSADIIRALLHQLEAECQRADAVCHDIRIQANDLKSARTVNKVLQGELAALKGDQVSVGKFVFEPSGERWHHIKHGEHQHAEPKLKLVKLYDRPQKPIIDLSNVLKVPYKISGQRFTAYDTDDLHAAIEAAGGIVKDGE